MNQEDFLGPDEDGMDQGSDKENECNDPDIAPVNDNLPSTPLQG